MPIIQGKILEGSTVHTDGWKAYDGLVLNGYDHYRVFHSHNEFARGKAHVNGICKCGFPLVMNLFGVLRKEGLHNLMD